MAKLEEQEREKLNPLLAKLADLEATIHQLATDTQITRAPAQTVEQNVGAPVPAPMMKEEMAPTVAMQDRRRHMHVEHAVDIHVSHEQEKTVHVPKIELQEEVDQVPREPRNAASVPIPHCENAGPAGHGLATAHDAHIHHRNAASVPIPQCENFSRRGMGLLQQAQRLRPLRRRPAPRRPVRSRELLPPLRPMLVTHRFRSNTQTCKSLNTSWTCLLRKKKLHMLQ